MNDRHSSERVVVGIDGSDAAINAAKWAVAEAVSRNIPLRLIYAVPQRDADGARDDDRLDIEYAQTSLRAADAALQAMGDPVKVECDIVHGSPESALIGASRRAALICVGSVGTGWVARKILGSTAGAVAGKALSPVAIIRSNRGAADSDSGYIAVAVDESSGNDAVLEHGFREARLREAPVLAMGVWRWGLGEIPYPQLDRRLGPWVSRYREVHVQPAAARHGAADFLTHTQEAVRLAVIGSEDADKVTRLVGPITPHLGGHAGFSVLVVRN